MGVIDDVVRSISDRATESSSLATEPTPAAACSACGCTVFYRYTSVGPLICGQCRPPDRQRVRVWRSVVLDGGLAGEPVWVPHNAEMAKAKADREARDGTPGDSGGVRQTGSAAAAGGAGCSGQPDHPDDREIEHFELPDGRLRIRLRGRNSGWPLDMPFDTYLGKLRERDRIVAAGVVQQQVQQEAAKTMQAGPPRGASIWYLGSDWHLKQAAGGVSAVPATAVCLTWDGAPGWKYLEQQTTTRKDDS